MEFMDGVILIEECTETCNRGYIMMIISCAITMVLSVGGSTLSELFEVQCKDIAKHIAACLSWTFLIAGIFITLKVVPDLDVFQEPNGKYKVTVSSNVDMNEFQSKYDIIDYDNDVYTVKPKDNVPQQPVSTQEETTVEVATTTEAATTEIDGKIYKIMPIE